MIWLILSIAVALRLISLGQSLWLDEAVQAITSQGSLSGVFAELTGDFHPPLYHLFMWGWVHLFGNSEIILRLPSVIFGIATVYLVYLIAKTLGFRKPVLVGLFMATAPYHIYYSQEVRAYSLSAMLATLSVYLFIKYILNTQPSRRTYRLSLIAYLLFLVNVLLLYSDYYGWFVFLAQLLVLFFLRRNRLLITYLLSLLACYLPWLPSLINQIKTGSLATQSLPGWGSLVNLSAAKAIPLTLLKFTIGRITIFDRQLYTVAAFLLLSLIVFLLVRFILALFQNHTGNQRPIYKILNTKYTILLWFFVPLICAWLVSFIIPNFQPFRLLLILPAFYLLLFIGISDLPVTIGRIMTVLLICINLISWFTYATNRYFWREDWRALCQLSKTTNAPVLLVSDTLVWPAQYYGCTPVAVGSGIAKVTTTNLSIIDHYGNNSYLYTTYLEDLYDPDKTITQFLSANGYNKTVEYHLNQIPVVLYKQSKISD